MYWHIIPTVGSKQRAFFRRWAWALVSPALALVGCPVKKPPPLLLEAIKFSVKITDHATNLPVPQDALTSARRYALDVETAEDGVFQVFAPNSGGSLSPVSDAVPVAAGKTVRLTDRGVPFKLVTYDKRSGVAPGGPIYVVGVRSAAPLQVLGDHTAGNPALEQIPEIDAWIRQHGVKIERGL